MIVDTVKYRGRINGQKGMHLVYVEFVESAPWNRTSLFETPRYRGVGRILMRAAVTLSQELEFRGRVGLHSLPQANAFSANHCGMTDLGPDSKYPRLRYFDAAVARRARGLFREHDTVLLDEPTAAIDPLEEQAVYERFMRIAAGRTAIIVTHRLASARLADRILVLDGGRIVEGGTHEQLLAHRGLYRRMSRPRPPGIGGVTTRAVKGTRVGCL